MSEAKKKKGGQPNNTNSVKHGKYSHRDFLLCSCCVAKSKCPEFNKENQMRVCVYEKKLEKPDLSTIEQLLNFLRELLSVDWLRFQRSIAFEKLSGGMLDADALKLEFHVNNVINTMSRLMQISNLEKRIEKLEQQIGGVK